MSKRRMSRRVFTAGVASLPLLELIPRGILGLPSVKRQVRIRVDSVIGLVRPELHGQFAEHVPAPTETCRSNAHSEATAQGAHRLKSSILMT
jgi:hypothetical protein